jgi:hypothetical protein
VNGWPGRTRIPDQLRIAGMARMRARAAGGAVLSSLGRIVTPSARATAGSGWAPMPRMARNPQVTMDRLARWSREGRVVAGPGADLQDPVTGLDVELLQHRGDNTGRGSRAERGSCGVSPGDNGVIGRVGGLGRHAGDEGMAGHRSHRGLGPARLDGSAGEEEVDQAGVELAGVRQGVSAHRENLSPAAGRAGE